MSTYQPTLPETMDAQRRFAQSRLQAKFNLVRSLVTRRAYTLLDLETVAVRCGPPDRHYAGIKSVPIRKIRGSESRSADFDRDFNPIHERTAGRWMSVYLAWLDGVVLPPVELVQVGDAYYVRDGHHRISVAHSLGNRYIDAEVTVLESFACPFADLHN